MERKWRKSVMKEKNLLSGFTKFDFGLWFCSFLGVIILFAVNEERDYYTLAASLIGVTMLIFLAKGNVIGQILTIFFSLLYGVISYRFRYYGEMITYLGMTAPIALLSVASWIRHPFQKGKNEVKVAEIGRRTWLFLFILTAVVTFLFYFILKFFGTANLKISTVSIATSFMASALMFLRSPFYAVAYACNDIVLIIMWILATLEDAGFMTMILCFCIFFLNDIYGFISWRKMYARQQNRSFCL